MSMFGYAKEDINKKIHEKKHFLFVARTNEKNFHQLLIQVRTCIEGRRYMKRQKNKVVNSCLLLALSIGFAAYFEFLSVLSIASLCTLGISGIGVVSGCIKLSRKRREMEKKFAKWQEVSLEDLSKEENCFFEHEFREKHRQMELTAQIRNLECDLEQLIRFENVHEDFEQIKTDPYYIADTASEYEKIYKTGVLCDQLFDDFLAEPPIFQDVHFDHSLEESFSCPMKENAIEKVYKF